METSRATVEMKLQSYFSRYRRSPSRKAAGLLTTQACATALAAILCLGVHSTQPTFAEPQLPPPAQTRIDFARHIAPILQRCQICHGAEQQMSGLRLDRREDAMRGGYSGAVIQPGKSASSRLILLVAGKEEGKIMPPIGDR